MGNRTKLEFSFLNQLAVQKFNLTIPNSLENIMMSIVLNWLFECCGLHYALISKSLIISSVDLVRSKSAAHIYLLVSAYTHYSLYTHNKLALQARRCVRLVFAVWVWWRPGLLSQVWSTPSLTLIYMWGSKHHGAPVAVTILICKTANPHVGLICLIISP